MLTIHIVAHYCATSGHPLRVTIIIEISQHQAYNIICENIYNNTYMSLYTYI